MVERADSGTAAPTTLATILDAWRAAERRLASGDGDRATLVVEVRRLREQYGQLQEERVRDERENGDDGWSDDSPKYDRPLPGNALTPSGSRATSS